MIVSCKDRRQAAIGVFERNPKVFCKVIRNLAVDIVPRLSTKESRSGASLTCFSIDWSFALVEVNFPRCWKTYLVGRAECYGIEGRFFWRITGRECCAKQPPRVPVFFGRENAAFFDLHEFSSKLECHTGKRYGRRKRITDLP